MGMDNSPNFETIFYKRKVFKKIFVVVYQYLMFFFKTYLLGLKEKVPPKWYLYCEAKLDRCLVQLNFKEISAF